MKEFDVGVWNEWDQLREVIVGDMTHDILPFWSPDWGRYEGCKEYSELGGGKTHISVFPERTIGTISQTNQLANFLISEGIVVHRPPHILTEEEKQLSPIGSWVQYPRDPHIVIGKNVIETNNRVTARSKEHLVWGPLWQKKAANDLEVKHIRMPTVTPFFSEKIKLNQDFLQDPRLFLEGGDTFILGKDILVGCSSLASSPSGINWLQNYLGEKWNVHKVKIKPKWIHLDCIFSVIREGLCMCCLEALDQDIPDPIKNWDIIKVTIEESHHMGTNTLCIEPGVVLIGSEHERLITEIKNYNATAIPIPFDQPSQWGGGIRCSTYPVNRKSN